MPSPGPIALKAIAEAENKNVLAVREVGGNNRGKEVETYLASVDLSAGDPWCDAFVYYRLMKAAQILGKTFPSSYPKTGYTPSTASYFKKRGQWISVQAAKANPSLVKRGDLVFFYFPAKGRIAHIGMVSSVDKNGIRTVEGNTEGHDTSGVSRDGGGVWVKERTWSNLGYLGGFGRITF